MLNKLKNKIESQNFINYKNIEIRYDKFIISADKFTGYLVIKEMVDISELIDTEIYRAEYLNNVVKVKVK